MSEVYSVLIYILMPLLGGVSCSIGFFFTLCKVMYSQSKGRPLNLESELMGLFTCCLFMSTPYFGEAFLIEKPDPVVHEWIREFIGGLGSDLSDAQGEITVDDDVFIK